MMQSKNKNKFRVKHYGISSKLRDGSINPTGGVWLFHGVGSQILYGKSGVGSQILHKNSRGGSQILYKNSRVGSEIPHK